MARKRRGLPIHGWLILDKPAGMSSSAAVGAVRRITNAAKAGHGGTLDPLATGVLPIALGEATKTVSYVMNGLKKYTFRIMWGESRTTDDEEGEVIKTSDSRPSEQEILAALPTFTGNIEQIPPIFSAIKVKGKRAYELARNDIQVELKSRPAYVESFVLENIPNSDCADFSVTSGKGVYMRSLARDIAESLGTVGYISNLRRVFCGPFSEENAISLDKLSELRHSALECEYLLPIKTALDDILALSLTEEEAADLSHGRPVSLQSIADKANIKVLNEGDTVCAMANDRLVALARIQNGSVCPVRVMNL